MDAQAIPLVDYVPLVATMLAPSELLSRRKNFDTRCLSVIGHPPYRRPYTSSYGHQPPHQSSESHMAEKRKGSSPEHKKSDDDERKKRRRHNPRSPSTEPDDTVRSRGRKPTKKYNPKAGMSTTPSPPVEYNQGTESVLSVSDLAPVIPRRPRRGRPKKLVREGQSGTRPGNNRRVCRDSQPHPQFPPPLMIGSSSSHGPVGRPVYAGEEIPNQAQLFHGQGFDQELHQNLFPIASPFRPSDTSLILNFDEYFSFPGSFGGVVQNNMDPMHHSRGGGGIHPVQFDAFELRSQYSPASIDQRSMSPSSQWSSDTVSRVSITPEERHFPTPYFFDSVPLADPHWPSHSSDSQGTFIPSVNIEEPGMAGQHGLVIEQFPSSQSFSGVGLNPTLGSLHGSSHQPSQSQNSHPVQHGMQGHIHYADCNCLACQHFPTSGWDSAR